jgi:hypothetical protein
LNRTIKNTFLIFWATAVLFICIGSLVNFHQHKIWGKALLPQLLYTKRDKEKSLDLLKSFKPGISNGHTIYKVIDFATIQDQPSILTAFCIQDLINGDFLFIPDLQQFPLTSLRGPPVA